MKCLPRCNILLHTNFGLNILFNVCCVKNNSDVLVTNQRQQQGVEVSDGAAGVEAQHPAALLQPLVDEVPQTRQQNLTLPQAVDVNWKSSQELRKHQLQDEHDTK